MSESTDDRDDVMLHIIWTNCPKIVFF